ncbi:hypothetical protein [Amorphus coralli]|uniref:hypothetical protein n=1 Tax=Amorphus coralli TaxID=340680 RepID=UPI0003616161|nr:hypothetical protein [Amorphus coralli]
MTRSLTNFSRLAAIGALLGAACSLSPAAMAGNREVLVGPHPWDFPDRNRYTSFAFQNARDNRTDEGLAGAAAIGAGAGMPMIVNSYSTAVGNWQQIEMTLAEGAEGLIMTENHQDNQGQAVSISDVMGGSETGVATDEAIVGN